MLEKISGKYYGEGHQFNCAEAMLKAVDEAYRLDLDHNHIKTMALFGGGMGKESVCGALTGGLAALGVLFIKNKARDSENGKEIAASFYERFINELSSDNCGQLKSIYRDDEKKCDQVVRKAARVLEQVIHQYQQKE